MQLQNNRVYLDVYYGKGEDMREIKFRAWNGKEIVDLQAITPLALDDNMNNQLAMRGESGLFIPFSDEIKLMQYTGLKDMNGVAEVYECDIIDESGLIVGNIYEVDKRKADFIIQGFGTKAWCETYRRAILLGCKDAE